METKINYAVVGAFVIILIAALMLGIIWLSAGFSTEKYSFYVVHMEEAVTGLSLDSPVKYNGVDVGTIGKIRLNPRNPNQVDLLLKIKDGTPITEGTRAMLNTQGLTGIAYLNLRGDAVNTKPLLAKPGHRFPVIPTAPSLMMRLDTTLSALSNNIQSVSDRVNQLLDPDNQRAFKEILLNLNQFAITLSANDKQLNMILQNTAKASQQFPELLASSKNLMQTFNEQTLPAANQAVNNFNSAANNLLQTSAALKQNPAILIRGQTTGTLGPGEQ